MTFVACSSSQCVSALVRDVASRMMLVGILTVFLLVVAVTMRERLLKCAQSASFDGDGRCASALAQLPTKTTSTSHNCVFFRRYDHFECAGGMRDGNNWRQDDSGELNVSKNVENTTMFRIAWSGSSRFLYLQQHTKLHESKTPPVFFTTRCEKA